MTNWKVKAAAVDWNIRSFIDGCYLNSAAVATFDTINPAVEERLCSYPVGSELDVDAAVSAARLSFDDGRWSELPPGRRAAVLMKLADLIVEHKDELGLLDALEMGKPIQAAIFDAEHYAAPLLRSWAGFADQLLGESAPSLDATVAFNTYEPRGVIGAITAWNFPSVNAIYKFGPALAAGNSIVLKPSELTPSSALRLAELGIEAGIPAGVLNVVPGLGSTVGAAMALHPGIDMLSFTGSTQTGRKILELCGRSNSKPVMLECGGKSPHVVFDDIDDLDTVAEAAARGILWNQGQVCAAHSRLVVHRDIKASLLGKILDRVSRRSPGDPLEEATDYGPLASAAQRDRVGQFIDQALAAGARPILEGAVQASGGCYVSPTIFDRVDNSMAIVRQEVFGPVLCVQEFSTEEQAKDLANATDYGLGATVWTQNMGRGKRMAHSIRAGAVFVRTSGKESSAHPADLSFEPRKFSGFGSERGIGGLKSYSNLKLVSFSGH